MRFETLFQEWSIICEAYGRIVRRITLANSDRVIEMAKQGDGLRTPADRRALNAALAEGRGSITLHLTEEQFTRLKDRTHRPRRKQTPDNKM
jgi:hypothetical protein